MPIDITLRVAPRVASRSIQYSTKTLLKLFKQNVPELFVEYQQGDIFVVFRITADSVDQAKQLRKRMDKTLSRLGRIDLIPHLWKFERK